MTKTLVIVESPAKARTIGKFLGDDFIVESSIGHVRDLPERAKDLPKPYKKFKGVDVDNDFHTMYVVSPGKKEQISKLKGLLKEADELLLATDEDREGESIAWHLVEVLKPKVPYRRMVFHEITKSAIQKAIESPREIDRNLVDAQEARRILDRLYGYGLSPVLWRKIGRGLSAGRVQSVATRVVVQRERERIRFQTATYWDLTASLAKEGKAFEAKLVALAGQRIASGRDFGEDGKLKSDALLLGEEKAKSLAAELAAGSLEVESVETKPYKRSPSAPFMTSTLQQEAGRKLRFGASRTMRAAQRLYEDGYITYMRTDSTTLSTAAIDAARSQIESLYGSSYLPSKPRTYSNKVKNAQEAHEAIRPAGDTIRTPEQVAKLVQHDQGKIYELIWKRTIASQMADAKGERVQARLVATTKEGEKAELTANGLTITFPGFLRAYVEGSDNPSAELEDKEKYLPALAEKEQVKAKEVTPESHETQAPARFTEASLVKRLEELGVGRPSTYASIISTIQDRGYVWRKGSALVPTYKALAVVTLLEQHFGRFVDYAFTARMEDELDEIASGREQTVPYLEKFYFGGDPAAASNDNAAQTPDKAEANGGAVAGTRVGLRDMVESQLEAIDARAINTLPIGKDSEGREIVVRVGKNRPYLQRGEDTVTLPDDIAPDELTPEKAESLLKLTDRELGADPESGLTVWLKNGPYGPYVQLGDSNDPEDKPKRESLFASMDPETLTLEQALKLLSIPRVVGEIDGEQVLARNGKHGAYITKGQDKGKDSRSLTSEDQIFTLTIDEAKKLFAQPKVRGRRQPKPPLRELGTDPVSESPIVMKEGQYGIYVSDGETNATLRTGDDPETLTPERAQELLQLRREKEAANPKKKTAKKPRKKAAAKKATKKGAAKKGGPKKGATKKRAAKKGTTKKTD